MTSSDGQKVSRRVRLVLNGQEGIDHEVDTGIPQGSPVSPILFTVYLSGLFGYMEDRVPGIKALSFVDDVAWTTEGTTGNGISESLEQTAAAAQEWATANAVSFDTAKTEAILLSGRRKCKTPAAPPRGIEVEGRTVHFNKQATRWLGVWLDSQLTLKDHHDVRMKKARNAQNRLRRLAGQVGLSPENCRKVQAACVQAAAFSDRNSGGRATGSKAP